MFRQRCASRQCPSLAEFLLKPDSELQKVLAEKCLLRYRDNVGSDALDVLGMATSQANAECVAVVRALAELQPAYRTIPFSAISGDEVLAVACVARSMPFARMHLAADKPSLLRCNDAGFRAAWTLFMWEQQAIHACPLLPACVWCGSPTGNTCDGDHGTLQKYVRNWIPLCSACENDFEVCRLCQNGKLAPAIQPAALPIVARCHAMVFDPQVVAAAERVMANLP